MSKLLERTVDGSQKNSQGVFKVESLALGNPKPRSTVTRSRKSHKKSRTGCGQCKARRVKCDETHEGGCLRCRNHGLADQCDFLRSQPWIGKRLVQIQSKETEGDVESEILRQSADTTSSLNGRGTEASEQDPFDDTFHALPLVILPSATSLFVNSVLGDCQFPSMTSPLATLHHFEELTAYTCGSPMAQPIIKSSILSLARQWAFLLHAMLGTAAAHMSHLLPADLNAVQHARNRAADAYHWGQALKLFRQALAPGGTRENMDALLTTIMLVAIHQFRLSEDDQSTPVTQNDRVSREGSFVLIDDDDKRLAAMHWLTIQSGFKVLLDQLQRFIADSMWISVLEDASRIPDGRVCDEAGSTTDDVERLLCDFCNITNESTEENNPYYGSLATVLSIRRLRPIRQEYFNKLIRVIGRLTHEMRTLLWLRDTAALLVLAHWLTLMAGLNQWWIIRRAEREIRAIISYLMVKDVGLDTKKRVRLVLREPALLAGVDIYTDSDPEEGGI